MREVEKASARLTDAELAALPAVRAEEHVLLALAVASRVFRRPTEDDRAEAVLHLVEAAALWNAGKRPNPWGAFAAIRIRWGLLYRFQLASAEAIRAEVPLFLPGDDEDEEVERREMAVEDPGVAEAAARIDVGGLLAGLEPDERYVVERRFGLHGEPATWERIAAELKRSREEVRTIGRRAMEKTRKRARRGRYAIP